MRRIRAILALALVGGQAAFALDLHTKALTPIVEKAPPPGGPLRFVEKGELNFVIVGDFGAERTANTRSRKSIAPAADFLAEAFEKTTGRRPDVLDARKDAARIAAAKLWLLVGDSSYARDAAGLDGRKMPPHGYEIKTFARGLAIVGFDSSLVDGWQMRPLARDLTSPGTEYGALDFCERFLGVRHYFPGEYGSIWPTCRDLTIPPVHYADAPYFASHGNSFHYWWAFSTDELIAKWRPYMGDGIRLKDTSFLRYWRQGTSKPLLGSHSPEPISYAAAHPDRLKDIFYTSPSGKFWYNPKEHVGNFYDVTNLKFADLLVADWKRVYETNGAYRPGRLDEGMTDTGVSFGICDTLLPLLEMRENPVVKELDLIRDAERQGPERAAMRNVFGRFFQYLGTTFAKELPGKELWLLIYYNSLYAPNDPRWKLPPNVNVWLCLGDMPRKLPSAARTAKNVAIAREWRRALGGRAPEVMWLYTADWDPFQRAIIPELTGGIPKAFGADFGRRGLFFDWGAAATELWHNYFAAYALEKAQWHPDFDVEAALEEHWVLFFGPKAGPHMRAFHRQLKDLYLRVAVPSDELSPLYPMAGIDALERELKAACDATAADSPEGRRVRLVADFWPAAFAAQRRRATSEKPVYDLAYVQTAADLARAPAIPLFASAGAADARTTASVRLGWNEKGLYGAVDAAGAVSNDVLELSLSPGLKKEVRYALAWDAAGNLDALLKRHLPIDQPPDRSWTAPGSRWKPKAAADGFGARFFVPFAALGDVTAKAYDLWYGNVAVRGREAGATAVCASSRLQDDLGDLNLYGYFRFAGRGDVLPREGGRKVISVSNAQNGYSLRAWREKPKGTARGELRLTLDNEMGAGFSGLVNWLKIEVNGISSRELVLQPCGADAFLFNFDGAKVKLTPYMDADSPLLKCRLEPAGGCPITSCKVCVTAIPSKLGKKDGQVMFEGNRRKIVSPRPGAWVLLDEENDGTSEAKGWGPSCVFADGEAIADVREEAGSSWTASVTFTLKPDFAAFRFGVYERDRVRQTNDEAVRFAATCAW